MTILITAIPLVILLLSNSDNEIMPNPFFSARIPPELLEKIKKHSTETGETKTQILIKALAAYVKYPLPAENPAFNSGVSMEAFTALEKRVVALEQLLETPITPIINSDNNDNSIESPVIVADNNIEQLPDLWAIASEPTSQDEEKQPLPETDKRALQPVIMQDSTIKLLSPPATVDNNQHDNDDNKVDNKERSQDAYPKYESLTSVELRKLTGMTQPQIDNHKRKVNNKYKKLGQPLEDKKLLKTPEEINLKEPITINGYPYNLFYIGQNEKGKDLWSMIPFDNSRYQQLSLDSSLKEAQDQPDQTEEQQGGNEPA